MADTIESLCADLAEARADAAILERDHQDAIEGLRAARADLSEARLALQQIDFMKGIPNTVHDIAREALGLTATPPAAHLPSHTAPLPDTSQVDPICEAQGCERLRDTDPDPCEMGECEIARMKERRGQ